MALKTWTLSATGQEPQHFGSTAELQTAVQELPDVQYYLDDGATVQTFADEPQLKAFVAALPPDPDPHAYFQSLLARPEFYRAWDLRSDAILATLENTKSDTSAARTLVYDPVQDAALGVIIPKVVPQLNGKILPFQIPWGSSSWFYAMEFMHSESFRFIEENQHPPRYKTWYHNIADGGTQMIQGRTDYKHAANVGKFNEYFFAMQNGIKHCVSGRSWTQASSLPEDPTLINKPNDLTIPTAQRRHWYGEGLMPRVGEMFYEPMEWVRPFFFFEDFDQPICLLSLWAATATQGVVPLLDRLALQTPPPGAPNAFGEIRISYDATSEAGSYPTSEVELQCWHRNWAVLTNVTRETVLSLLQPPPSNSNGPDLRGIGR